MKIVSTAIEGVYVIEPTVFKDGRGWFREVFSERNFRDRINAGGFVQENESLSDYGVIRGLHYQLPPKAQGKLVRVARGRILDVAVDIRRDSPTFGKHAAVELNDDNLLMLWVPRGCAHGFSTLSEQAKVIYLCDEYYEPRYERSIAYNDGQLGIDWLIPKNAVNVSLKDSKALPLTEVELFENMCDCL